jgi:ABC-2 type transport system permease protein
MNLTVAQLTLRSLLGRRRVWLLLPLPMVLIGLALLGHLRHPHQSDWVLPVVAGLGFTVVVPILALIIGTSVVGSEIDDGTLVHLLTKPLSRSEILLAKLVVAVGVTAVVTGVPMFVAGALASGARFGLGLAIGALLASAAYNALFVALSVLSRRPVLIGLAYILLWEGLLTNLLKGTRVLSVEQYALTVAARIGGSSLLSARMSLVTAIVMAAVFVVAGTVLAIDRLRSFTVAGETS